MYLHIFLFISVFSIYFFCNFRSPIAAYQVEGAWDEDGKGVSIWDTYSHDGSINRNNETGDIACDSYHKMEEDIAMIKSMNLNSYRFSLSWTRFFPDGRNLNTDPEGFLYYDRFINRLLEENIEPMVTLFHWDLPQTFQDEFEGFDSREIVEHFTYFADFAFARYSDRVKYSVLSLF